MALPKAVQFAVILLVVCYSLEKQGYRTSLTVFFEELIGIKTSSLHGREKRATLPNATDYELQVVISLSELESLRVLLNSLSLPILINSTAEITSINTTTVCSSNMTVYQCRCEESYAWSYNNCISHGACDRIIGNTCGCINDLPADNQYCQPKQTDPVDNDVVLELHIPLSSVSSGFMDIFRNNLNNVSFPRNISQSLILVDLNFTTGCYPNSTGGLQCQCEDEYAWSCNKCIVYGHCSNTSSQRCSCINGLPPDREFCQPITDVSLCPTPPPVTMTTVTAFPNTTAASSPTPTVTSTTSIMTTMQNITSNLTTTLPVTTTTTATTTAPVTSTTSIMTTMQNITSNLTTTLPVTTTTTATTTAPVISTTSITTTMQNITSNLTTTLPVTTTTTATTTPVTSTTSIMTTMQNITSKLTTNLPVTTTATATTTTPVTSTTSITTTMQNITSNLTTTLPVTTTATATTPTPGRKERLDLFMNLPFKESYNTPSDPLYKAIEEVIKSKCREHIKNLLSVKLLNIRNGSTIAQYEVEAPFINAEEIENVKTGIFGELAKSYSMIYEGGTLDFYPNKTFFFGQTMIVKCGPPPQNLGKNWTAEWTRNSKLIVFDDQHTVSEENGQSNLTVKSFLKGDEGLYECKLKFGESYFRQTGEPKAEEKPDILVKPLKRLVHCKNESVTLECSVNGTYKVKFKDFGQGKCPTVQSVRL
ncbi:uncharacterized protein LOC142375136 [Odontesthes bonariensis]|uniref:uncharacterized protein LOC142375136 n=1 Tax=Odontesthes bonariensis TaxID=219752 RepID=UPI003F58087A